MFNRRPWLTIMSATLLAPSLWAQQQDSSQQEIDRQLKAPSDHVSEEAHPDNTVSDPRVAGPRHRKPSWPEPQNPESITFRFIRLEHKGVGWNDGMGMAGADTNLLTSLAELTGLRAAKHGESHPVMALKKYPEDGFPPFVFLTGNGAIGRVTRDEITALREYCLNGGMLVADAGSQMFHRSFLQLMRRVFPDKELVDISNDDSIYQVPHLFPDGCPSFWHHGGRRAIGIKHKGRWAVFYHLGDMNDAWKSEGYSDVTPEMRESAMQLGVNIVYYAFRQWSEAINKKSTKKASNTAVYDLPDMSKTEGSQSSEQSSRHVPK